MRNINSFSILMLGVLLAGCKADMICPAYQSYFLIDEGTQRNQFGYFAQDSLPRKDVFYSTLDKNGLVAKTSLLAYIDKDWVRERELRTINMDVVYPILSDSLLFAGDVMMYAETDVVDSTALDSARVAAQAFRYGADQKYYNWYFRDKLVWKDELEGNKLDDSNAKDNKAGKAGFFGFFKNLFKKKEKPVVDEDSTEANLTESLETEVPQKKGLFKNKELFKKKDKKPKEPRQKKEKTKKNKKEAVLEEKSPNLPAQEEDDGEDDF